MDSPSGSISSVRLTKRKFEDAIRTLDGAVASPSSTTTIDRATPSKRPHLSRSVYSTLAKFGGTSKESSRPSSSDSTTGIDVSKNAPHLTAILARSVSQAKHVPSFNHSSTPPPFRASEYRPSSTDAFLARLATYKITTYANKPPQIDAVAAARCGWINDGKDRLICGMCDVSWVLAGREGMKKDAANALIEKQRVSLIEMHKDGCPWKARQSEPSVYRVPLQTPSAMVRELKTIALSLEPMLRNVVTKHPLTPPQLSSLHSVFFLPPSQIPALEHDSTMDVGETILPVLSDTAIIVALFGWIPAPIAASHPTPSISHAGSFGPSASMPPTPSISRTNSISSSIRERASTSTPSSLARMSISQFSDHIGRVSHLKSPSSHNTSTFGTLRETPLVYCVLCQRRVGLWGHSRSEATTRSTHHEYTTTLSHEHHKEFDLVKEHRSYCPYIVCSSMVPSFSRSPVVDSPRDAMEGWRAVLTVVQRHELGDRQRLSHFLTIDGENNQASSAELNGVKAMVAGVKTNGGRDLLKYVKTVLG